MSGLSFRLVIVTDADSVASANRSVLETVRLICEARRSGAASSSDRVAIMLRDKNASKSEVRRAATDLHEVTAGAGVPLLVHSHWHIARDLDLAGAHLSATGDVSAARSGLRAHQLLGASRHAGDVIESHLDYAFLSPVFAPTSKPKDKRPPLLPAGLALAVRGAGAPVFALGGIQPHNARHAFEAGAAGVAVVGAVMAAADPVDAVKRLIMAIETTGTEVR